MVTEELGDPGLGQRQLYPPTFRAASTEPLALCISLFFPLKRISLSLCILTKKYL